MFQKNILLKNHSHYKIGGPASYFFEARSIEEIIKATDKWRRLHPKTRYSDAIFILGAGTNILFSDEGFDGLILKIQNSKVEAQNDNSKFKIIKAEAGVPLSKLVNMSAEMGLTGLEWAAGLPGTIAGAIYGNAGAFGGEIKDIVKEVVSLDISKPQPKIIKRKNEDCIFDYRSSIFKAKKPPEVIIEAILILRKGERESIQAAIKKNIAYRRQNQPLEYPSAGSIFKNVPLKKVAKNQQKAFLAVVKKDPFPLIPAAYLISEAGLRGISCGGAMISPQHPNFIVNVLGASSNDVKNLIELAKNKVRKIFNITLEEEITYLA